MIKKYKNKEEKIAAFMQAVKLRECWEQAVSGRLSSSQMADKGFKVLPVSRWIVFLQLPLTEILHMLQLSCERATLNLICSFNLLKISCRILRINVMNEYFEEKKGK